MEHKLVSLIIDVSRTSIKKQNKKQQKHAHEMGPHVPMHPKWTSPTPTCIVLLRLSSW